MKVTTIILAGETRIVWRCPACKCSHGVPIDGARKWDFNGNMESPSLSPSILISYGGANPPDRSNICHCFIRNGNIEYCSDCSHDLAGKTVEIPNFES